MNSLIFGGGGGRKREAPLFHSIIETDNNKPIQREAMDDSSDSQNFLGAFNGMYDSGNSIQHNLSGRRADTESLDEEQRREGGGDDPFVLSPQARRPPTLPHVEYNDDEDIDLSERDSEEAAREAKPMPGAIPPRSDKVSRTLHIEEEPDAGHRSKSRSHDDTRDAPWLAAYLSALTITLLIALWAYAFANPPIHLPVLSADRRLDTRPVITNILATPTVFTTTSVFHTTEGTVYPTEDAEPWPDHSVSKTYLHDMSDNPVLEIADPEVGIRESHSRLKRASEHIRIATHSEESNEADEEIQEALSLLSVLPLVTSVTLCSVFTTLGALFVLSKAVRRAVYALLVIGPASLIAVAFWGFGSSFSAGLADGDSGEYGTEVRWACFAAILIAGLSARMIHARLNRLEKTVQVVELATTALVAHPALLVVQGALLLSHLVVTLPFFALFIRLLLLHPTNPDRPVLLMSLFVMGTYLWSLSLFRNMARLTTAITLSNWYFTRHDPSPLFRTSAELVTVAWEKTKGPQLGTVALASLVITLVNIASFILVRLKRWLKPSNGLLPPVLSFLYHLSPLVVFLAGIIEGLSTYALIWSGITGESFWPSAVKAGQLVRGNGMSRTADYLLIKLILTLLTLSFSILAGLLGLLTVSKPTFAWPSSASAQHLYHHAFSILLSFCIPYYAVRLSSDLLGNSIDCLFICFNVDLDRNENHCTKAQEAFTTARLEEEEDFVV